jgi:hypothetical protein
MGVIPLILSYLIKYFLKTKLWEKNYLPFFLTCRQYISTFVDFQNPHVNHHSQQKNPQQMEFQWCGF